MKVPDGETVRLWFQEDGEPRWRHYGLAGLTVSATGTVRELTPFTLFGVEFSKPDAPAGKHRSMLETLAGRNWLAGRRTRYLIHTGDEGARLELEGRQWLRCRFSAPAVDLTIEGPRSEDQARYAALGPGLTLALAACGRWSLHASAFQIGDRVVAAAGESGAGKSTFARVAEAAGHTRLADDQVILAGAGPGLKVLPRFPQLKMGPDQQPLEPASAPLGAIVFPRRRPDVSAPTVRPLAPSEAVTRILANLTASSLFAQWLRAAAFDLFTGAAPAVDAVELVLPDSLDALPEAVGAIVDRIGGKETGG